VVYSSISGKSVIDRWKKMQSKQKYYFYLNAFIGILFFLLGGNSLLSQILPSQKQNQIAEQKEQVLMDSSISQDASLDTNLVQRQYVRYSKDSLSAPIDASCKDSMILDNKNKKLFLFGEAVVNYEKVELKAGFIELDWDNNIVTAKGTGTKESDPTFKEGEQEISAAELRYNFKTQKGKVFQSTSQQNDIVIHSEQAKFIRTAGKDSTQNDVLFSVNSIFTTCTADHPHFGIRSTKQKIIPNKLIIVGPSRLEIMDIPTPIWLPFGFFPINPQSKSSTGLLFPRD
jgi:lipopolysaccharide assembly outer membrane protein LptD (OstA)